MEKKCNICGEYTHNDEDVCDNCEDMFGDDNQQAEKDIEGTVITIGPKDAAIVLRKADNNEEELEFFFPKTGEIIPEYLLPIIGAAYALGDDVWQEKLANIVLSAVEAQNTKNDVN